jgi:hypothetical protein
LDSADRQVRDGRVLGALLLLSQQASAEQVHASGVEGGMNAARAVLAAGGPAAPATSRQRFKTI